MIDTSPLVSVVIPAYNSPDYTNEAIESVRRQTFRDKEVVLVDDASGDAVTALYALGEDIRLVRHETRRGPAAARNTGIANSRGRYIALLDQDDVWLPNKLERQVEALDTMPGVGLVYCHYVLTDQRLQPLTEQPDPAPLSPSPLLRFLRANPIRSCSGVLIRREVYDNCGGFDECLMSADDWDMWIKIVRSVSICSDTSPLYLYRTHPNQVSAKSLIMLREEAVVREKCLVWAEQEGSELAAAVSARMASCMRKLAAHELLAGELLDALVHARRSVSLAPLDIRSYCTYVATKFKLLIGWRR